MRCVLHASTVDRSSFLTLTYDESRDGYCNKLCYADIQKFKKRLRRFCDYHLGTKLQIFNVHEYGKNGKKHWHLICFGEDFNRPLKLLGGGIAHREIYTYKNGIPLYTHKRLEQLWLHGFVTIGDVSEASALYQAQYTQKDFKNGNTQNEKKSKSNHSGIGKNYFEKNYGQILRLGYIPFGGKKNSVPRYFERIAHKHWCHFNDPSAFFDIAGCAPGSVERRRLYTPFKNGEENSEIAQLFVSYIQNKKSQIVEREEGWKKNIVDPYFKTGEDPEFMQSLKNAYYDLKNKNYQERF
jgi:hypothetical protein